MAVDLKRLRSSHLISILIFPLDALFWFCENLSFAPGMELKYFLSFSFADFSLSHPFSRSAVRYKVHVMEPVFVSEPDEITLVPPTLIAVNLTPLSSFFPISSSMRRVSSVTLSVVPFGSSTSIPTVSELDSGMKIKPTNLTPTNERNNNPTRTAMNFFLCWRTYETPRAYFSSSLRKNLFRAWFKP